MKGTIHFCLEKTIISNFGESKWKECLLAVGQKKTHTFGSQILQDIDETASIELFVKSAETLDITLKQLFDHFGVYWSCIYALEMYPQFYEGKNSTKDFIVSLDRIHQQVTNKKPGAKPPKFIYEWNKDGTLNVTYQSHRDLFELFDSLLKGMDKHFGSETEISRIGQNKMTLNFDAASSMNSATA
ncbi:MAG: heme NO-binding domain-containing protein [Cyclobacteriaceae bacterium]